MDDEGTHVTARGGHAAATIHGHSYVVEKWAPCGLFLVLVIGLPSATAYSTQALPMNKIMLRNGAADIHTPRTFKIMEIAFIFVTPALSWGSPQSHNLRESPRLDYRGSGYSRRSSFTSRAQHQRYAAMLPSISA